MSAPAALNATPAMAGSVASLAGKVALVTGGESGIGQGIAIAMARAGAFVVVTGRDERGGSVSQRAAGLLKGRAAEPGSETVRQIVEAGGRAEYMKLDVTHENDWKRVIGQIETSHRRLDILVNNAGATGGGALSDTDIAMVWRMLHLNTEGAFLGVTHAWPLLKAARGLVINVNTAGLGHGSAGAFAYPSAKHGMHGITMAAAADGRPLGIRAISLNPGGTWTGGMARSRKITEDDYLKQTREGATPLKRPAYPADLGAAAVFLASDAARALSGIHWFVDGGSSAR
jgi:cyclopentanol dehydrogenase